MAEESGPSHILQVTQPHELVGNGNLVNGLTTLVERNARGIDSRVNLVEEVVGLERRDDLQNGIRVYEQRAKKRLLRLDVVGRELLVNRHTCSL
jgi:hypothetical protein